MPQGPGTYGSKVGRPRKSTQDLMKERVLEKKRKSESLSRAHLLTKDPALYDERGRRRKKPLPAKAGKVKRTLKKADTRYDEEKYGFPGIKGGD